MCQIFILLYEEGDSLVEEVGCEECRNEELSFLVFSGPKPSKVFLFFSQAKLANSDLAEKTKCCNATHTEFTECISTPEAYLHSINCA